ncbi:hypothetical protein N0V90_008361 [Kalmusia sp. IMI 367209]|nr:hypothetical protein N0V90_008361 [Kalmusia sp. IMI 367209]
MAVASPPRNSRTLHRRTPSSLDSVPEDLPIMTETNKSRSEPELGVSEISSKPVPGDATHAGSALLSSESTIPQSTPGLSRSNSFSNSSAYMDDSDAEEAAFFPPVERLTMFDFIENLALTQRVEKIQSSISAQTERLKKAAKTRTVSTRDRAIEEWRRRVPPESEQLEKYKKRMRQSVDRLNEQWASNTAVTAREKASFIAAVMNIFVSGYLVGGRPEWFPLWYTAQLFYFMPLRYYTYHKKGYHYFLADLCYFVNALLVLSLWVFPRSKRLFISTYCLAFGNNAIAIVMWRNSLVFHSMDKVVSLFIHIMPCATLHCVVHLLKSEYQQQAYPAIWNIRNAAPDSPHRYGLLQMMLWATIPYAIWQLSYHFMITVRRREKIAAGRPTSFTWLRKSYAKNFLGRFVLSLPEYLQEPAFMMIQYTYAVLTMVPCPLWFWSRWASGGFLTVVFIWSTYNGANYYIEVYSKRFQKELEQLKKDVAKWQNSPTPITPMHQPAAEQMKEFPLLDGATSTGAKTVNEEARKREV